MNLTEEMLKDGGTVDASIKAGLPSQGLLAQMQQDAAVEAQRIPADAEMFRLRNEVKEKLELEKMLLRYEEWAAKKRERVQELTETVIPNLFHELGIGQFKLDDDTVIEVSKKYYASIKSENQLEAFSWLRKQNHGDLIKNEVKIEFGKGDDKLARKFLTDLKRRAKPPSFTQREFVHPQTLGAFVREQHEAGAALPMELLGAHIADVAKVKPAPKAKKEKA